MFSWTDGRFDVPASLAALPSPITLDSRASLFPSISPARYVSEARRVAGLCASQSSRKPAAHHPVAVAHDPAGELRELPRELAGDLRGREGGA